MLSVVIGCHVNPYAYTGRVETGSGSRNARGYGEGIPCCGGGLAARAKQLARAEASGKSRSVVC